MLTEDAAHIDLVRDGELTTDEVPALLALNHDLRTEYVADCQNGLKRWNRVLEKAGIERGSPCPTSGSTATSGCSPGTTSRPTGELVGADVWAAEQRLLAAHRGRQDPRPLADAPGLRARQDRRLDRPAVATGINDKPFEYEYVHFP